jgi:hypothetical protein
MKRGARNPNYFRDPHDTNRNSHYKSMSSLFARLNAVVPIVAAASLAGKEYHFYKLDGSNKAVIVAAATDVPDGLILGVTQNGLEISAAPFGGNHGVVKVKLGTAITDLRNLLTLKADGTAESDDAAGARVLVARPLELGNVDEEIECVLLSRPIAKPALTAATVITTLNSTAVNPTKADFDALLVEVEKLRQDVIALTAA